MIEPARELRFLGNSQQVLAGNPDAFQIPFK
jgi:hypothetical protein